MINIIGRMGFSGFINIRGRNIRYERLNCLLLLYRKNCCFRYIWWRWGGNLSEWKLEVFVREFVLFVF